MPRGLGPEIISRETRGATISGPDFAERSVRFGWKKDPLVIVDVVKRSVDRCERMRVTNRELISNARVRYAFSLVFDAWDRLGVDVALGGNRRDGLNK